MKQPNVLFILSDQHNAKCLGHKGHPDVKTPHLDRLAEEGVRFDKATTQNPICTPSRMCFLSGQYAHNHGYYGLSGPNPNGLPTIFGHFKRHGYRTGAIGKVHCPEYWVEDDCDVFHETAHSSIGGRSPAYARFLREREVEHLEDHAAWQEFGRRGQQTCDGRPSKVSYEESQEGWSVARAKEFMQAAQADGNPFILQVGFPKPHQCYTPAQEFWDLYNDAALTLPPNADAAGPHRAPHLAAMADRWRRAEGWALLEPKTFEAARRRKLQGYFGNISHIDHAVGELLDGLADAGLADDTIVIYSSDHGDYAAEHGIMEKAPGICHDAITRIPFIWRWAQNFKAGHVAPELVETVDLSATLCSLCDLPALETSDGKNLSPLLKGESGELRDIAVTEFAWSKSVRKGDWRFVYYPPEMFKEEYPDGFGELYNLADDPWEMNNRYFDENQQARINEIKADLLNWLVTTTRPVSTNCADLETGPQRHRRHGVVVNADNKIHPDNLRAIDYKNYL